MRFRFSLLGLFLIFVFQVSPAQSLDLARKDIQVLCSDQLAGRGYQENGHGLAAKYISERFAELGLEPWSPESTEARKTWFQPFSFQVNLVESLAVRLNKKSLQPGTDFILHPLSGSGSGTFSVKNLDHGMGEDWEGNKVRNRAVLFQMGYPEDYRQDAKTREMFQSQTELAFKLEMAALYQPALLMIRKEKLTAGLASQTLTYPIIEIHRNALPKKVKSITTHIETKVREISTFNVVGAIPGSKFPDSIIILSAHYDHLGKQGSAIFRGANDNASGVAFLLAMAGEFMQAENQPECTLLFIAFGAEEAGLKGSKYFVDKLPLQHRKKIKFVLNFDLMSNGDAGICLVAGMDFPALAEKIKSNLPVEMAVELRPNAPNSDHYPFILAGIPALFTYTKGGPPWYHDVQDIPEGLLFPKWEELKNAYLRTIRLAASH
jgi:aminopeptidase YwaD